MPYAHFHSQRSEALFITEQDDLYLRGKLEPGSDRVALNAYDMLILERLWTGKERKFSHLPFSLPDLLPS